MKLINKYISAIVMLSAATMGFTSCSDDKLGETIFPDVQEEVDPTLVTYKFDKWLKENYLDVYNLDFRYKMQDVGTDMNYNLVPATFQKAQDLALLAKYLWFDVYKDVVNPDFLKQYGPRIIHLIGSPAYNPNSGTMILGLAEGGIKVSLFRVNSLDVNSADQLNEYYFKTMHHEFAHILHQTKTYPAKFNTISVGKYDGSNWQDRQEGVVLSMGFVTPYASSAYREDFAEIIANYIVKTDAQWARFYDLASRGWESPSGDDPNAVFYCYYYYPDNVVDEEKKQYFSDDNMFLDYETPDGEVIKVYGNKVTKEYYRGTAPYTQDSKDPSKYTDAKGRAVDASGFLLDSRGKLIPIPVNAYAVEDKDGIDGPAALTEKIQIAREWLHDAFGVDLDKLRDEVQKRQANFDIKELRKQLEDVQ
ncbi:MAG: putative zinc-binding metallopeptidase [Bacteroidales bacterium]|nr:putative zinc-binding metallopeptidase [Bacteroidales bacterium]